MSDFKIGDKVQFKQDVLADLYVSVQKKVSGRIGVVTGLSYPNGKPVVDFMPEGRKRHFRAGVVNPSHIELVKEA